MTLILKFLTGEFSRIDKLRLMITLGSHGRAHKYADHVWIHYNDHTYIERVEFYREFHMDKQVVWG